MFNLLRKATAGFSADYILARVTIAHFIPGRIRVIWPELKQDPSLRQEVKARLDKTAAINFYRINEIIGSVLIEYDVHKAAKDPFISSLLSKAAQRRARENRQERVNAD